MPVSVTCPACSTAFSVKDEYAGKRGKCPQCAEPVTIPAVAAPPIPAARPVAAPVMATPVVARPVVAARVPPKPPADEEEAPAPKSKRRRDEDDEDEPPVRSKRKRGEDDDDEPPVSPKRKRGASSDNDEDETPKKKGRARDDEEDTPKKKSRRGDDDDDKPASKSRKGNDDEEDKPAPKRKRGGDSDEDDKPAPKRARGAAAEDDDTPKRKRGGDDDSDAPKGGRRRRRDDDDDKPKKKSALPLILGILAGVLVLCCGGPTGLYFFWLKPAGEKVLQEAEAEVARRKKEQEEANAKANPTTSTERPKEQPPVADLKLNELISSLRTDRKKYDKKWIRVTGPVTRVNTETQPGKPEWGQVYLGVLQTGLVVCHFDWGEWAIKPAFSDDQVYSVVGLFDANELGVSMSHCRVDGFAAANPATFVMLADLIAKPATHLNRLVDVSGPIQQVTPDGGGWKIRIAPIPTSKGVEFFIPNGTKLTQNPQPGDTISVRGVVARDTRGQVELTFRSLIAHFPSRPPPPPPPAALSVAEVLKDADKGFRNGNVTVRGKVKLVLQHVDGDQGTIVFEETDGKFTLTAVFPPGKWRKDFVRGGEDTIDVNGTLRGPNGNPGTGLHYDIENCDLLRRVGKDGKEVPLPPVTPPNKPVVATAENLAAEFAKNPIAAAAKYTDKTITVTGTVEKVTLPSGSRVTLKGVAADGTKKAYTVEVGMNLDMRDAAKEFKQGDTVKLTGKFSNFRPAIGTSTPNGVLLTAGVIEK